MVLLLDFSEVFATIREIETGGRLMRDIKSRRRTTLLKDDSVRPVARGSVYLSSPKGAGLTGQEAVQLHEQLEIDIIARGRLAVRAANVMSVEIDTCM
jgi:uncharacterized protein (DUF2345 family)